MKHDRKSDLDFLFRRLDEIRMSDYERIRAKAHLERAAAVADLLAGAGAAIGRLYRRLFTRPTRRRVRASTQWG